MDLAVPLVTASRGVLSGVAGTRRQARSPAPPSHGASTVTLNPWVRVCGTLHETVPWVTFLLFDCQTFVRPFSACVSRSSQPAQPVDRRG